ncbi:hypothetical protein NQ318_013816 [Aromia moschata]|uniref:DUF4817 domain-containing protein n=1 Tax=Aromia moschata TaxID=1265417 RepID=A0AAV8ZAD0_9CUCU|nr:hypothetical protein NQ318_013816 [Aromia moschata]
MHFQESVGKIEMGGLQIMRKVLVMSSLEFHGHHRKEHVLNFKNMFLSNFSVANSISYEALKSDAPGVAFSAETAPSIPFKTNRCGTHFYSCLFDLSYEVCKLSNETGNIAPDLATLRIRDLEGRECCVAETVRKLRTIFGRNEAPSATSVRKFLKKVRETGMLMDNRSHPRARPVRTAARIAVVAQQLKHEKVEVMIAT